MKAVKQRNEQTSEAASDPRQAETSPTEEELTLDALRDAEGVLRFECQLMRDQGLEWENTSEARALGKLQRRIEAKCPGEVFPWSNRCVEHEGRADGGEG